MDFLSFERQYIKALEKVKKYGILEHNRTGIDTKALQSVHFNYSGNNIFPILRGKKVYPYMALKECVWMLMGRTDIKWLHDHKVTYWDEWALPDGTIGKAYGYQYRNFNGVDQVKKAINTIIEHPDSRRNIISLWNQNDINEMALPPCMYDYHFMCVPYISNKTDNNPICYKVNMHVRMRSADSFLGVPYDVMFTFWMLNIFVLYCNGKITLDYYKDLMNIDPDSNIKYKTKFFPGEIYMTCDDFHIYVNHKDAVSQYLNNVNENKNGIIDMPTYCKFLKPELRKNLDIFESIDTFLSYLDRTGLNKNGCFKLNTPDLKEGIEEYGSIKADVAV